MRTYIVQQNNVRIQNTNQIYSFPAEPIREESVISGPHWLDTLEWFFSVIIMFYNISFTDIFSMVFSKQLNAPLLFFYPLWLFWVTCTYF